MCSKTYTYRNKTAHPRAPHKRSSSSSSLTYYHYNSQLIPKNLQKKISSIFFFQMGPLSLLLTLSLLLPASAFSPADNYLVDCGSENPTTTVHSDHRRFSSDNSEFLCSTRTIRLTDPNPSPESSPVLNSARVFSKPSKYSFRIVEKGTHLIRLHFRAFDSRFDLFSTQFHVSANGFVLLYNFTVGAFSQTASVRDYMLWVGEDELVITFTPSEGSKFAFVNAIEVLSAPNDLIADVATLVSDSERVEKISGLKNYALETVYRVNVGGPKVTPFNDSLWRTWVTDDKFLKTSDGSKIVRFGGRIKYQKGGASREVGPDNVYNSARVISSSKDSVPKTNILWEFPVKGGYKYLVRLHFCDIASASLSMIYFNVYLNGNLVYENLDLSAITNWVLASPFYADFVVDGTKGLGLLSVSVGPSNMSMVNGIDGILNGIEIMKMNNSMRSLDGEVCAESISMTWQRGGGSGAMVPLVAVLCLLVIASLMMHRRWDRIKDSVAWTPLPVAEVDLKSGVRLSLRK